MDIIIKLIDHFKSPKYLLVVSMVSGFLIFGENDLLHKLALLSFSENYRLWIGVVFLISMGFWLVDIVLLIKNEIKRKYTYFKNKNNREKRLKQLTNGEKIILSTYINKKSKTQVLDYRDGNVCELETFRIIRQASNISQGHTMFYYNIQPWAWEYLNKHKELLNDYESRELVEL